MSREVKRNVALRYLQNGYTIEGLEIMNGSSPVMSITSVMKRWLERNSFAARQKKQNKTKLKSDYFCHKLTSCMP